MAKTYLVNGQVYIGRAFENKTLCMEEGKLTVLDSGCDTADGTVFDAQGLKVVPGFIDTIPTVLWAWTSTVPLPKIWKRSPASWHPRVPLPGCAPF